MEELNDNAPVDIGGNANTVRSDPDGASSLAKNDDEFRYELFSRNIPDNFLKLQEEANRTNKEFQEKKLSEIEEGFKTEIDKKIGDLESKIENSKLSIIETLGIFVALFTFISVDFQVFKSYRNPIAIGSLTSILIGSIFFFIIFFDYFILQARKANKTSLNINKGQFIEDIRASRARKWFLAASSVFIVVGVFSFQFAPMENFEYSKNQIKTEVMKSVADDIRSQNMNAESISNGNKEMIEAMNADIGSMKKCIKNFGFTYKCFE